MKKVVMGASSAAAFHQNVLSCFIKMFYLEVSASIFEAYVISYMLMIYLHIDLKAGFIIKPTVNQTKKKKYQVPTGCTNL